MKATWKVLLIKVLIWATTETLLIFLGLDDLSDCSEFVFRHHAVAADYKTTAPIALLWQSYCVYTVSDLSS